MKETRSKKGIDHRSKKLTFILLMWTFGRAPNNASKWEMGFNYVEMLPLGRTKRGQRV